MKGQKGLVLLVIILLLNGCATSEQARDVQPTGFLGDYSKLWQGREGEPLLFYKNPDISFRNYDKALIDPVTVWRGTGSTLEDIPERDLRRLVLLMKVKIIEAVKREGMQVVKEPGPGVMRIRVALTEAQKANQVMHVFSSALPLPSASKMATGTRAFVGTAALEGEITDSVTGDVLMAGVDRRGGGRSFEGLGLEKGTRNPWSHVEKAFQYWSDRFSYRICKDRAKFHCVPPE